MIVRIFEALSLIFIVGFLVSQVIFPALSGNALFPLFKKAGKLEEDLADAHQAVHDSHLEEEVIKLRKEAEEIAAKAAKKV